MGRKKYHKIRKIKLKTVEKKINFIGGIMTKWKNPYLITCLIKKEEKEMVIYKLMNQINKACLVENEDGIQLNLIIDKDKEWLLPIIITEKEIKKEIVGDTLYNLIEENKEIMIKGINIFKVKQFITKRKLKNYINVQSIFRNSIKNLTVLKKIILENTFIENTYLEILKLYIKITELHNTTNKIRESTINNLIGQIIIEQAEKRVNKMTELEKKEVRALYLEEIFWQIIKLYRKKKKVFIQ